MNVRSRAAIFAAAMLSAPAYAQLEAVVEETGRITLSADAVGSTLSRGSRVDVHKPKDATVRGAWMLACAHDSWGNAEIRDGDIRLAGSPIAIERGVWGDAARRMRYFHNAFADVTEVLQPILDEAPAGRIGILVEEADTFSIDGVALFVVFDDPNASAQNGFRLYFGQSDPIACQFNMDLPAGVDAFAADVETRLGFGIGHAVESDFAPDHATRILVNDKLLTKTAAGADDGYSRTGALITLGGHGDEGSGRELRALDDGDADDELYDARPYLDSRTDKLRIRTKNLRGDDNLFAAYVHVRRPLQDSEAARGGALQLGDLAQRAARNSMMVQAQMGDAAKERREGWIIYDSVAARMFPRIFVPLIDVAIRPSIQRRLAPGRLGPTYSVGQ